MTPECRVKSVSCKTCAGTLVNCADPDQMPQNAACDQGLHCLLKLQEVKVNERVCVPVQDHLRSILSETIDQSVLPVL